MAHNSESASETVLDRRREADRRRLNDRRSESREDDEFHARRDPANADRRAQSTSESTSESNTELSGNSSNGAAAPAASGPQVASEPSSAHRAA